MTEVKVALLQALISGDSYGLEIIDRVREATHGRFVMMQGRVYPALRELESEGLLESYDGDPLPERGGRPRRYYRLTAEGRRVAKQDAKALYGLLRPALGMA
jgi:PadR family transcriptional regulator PadR